MSPEQGFSLLETMVALTLTSLVLACGIGLFIQLQQGLQKLTAKADVDYQASVLQRMLAQSIHAATASAVVEDQLTVWTCDGNQLAYRVNQGGQLVQVGQTGGTAVLAVHVTAWHVVAHNGLVEARVYWKDGESSRFVWSGLEAIAK